MSSPGSTTLVIQSCSPAQRLGWQGACLATVRDWAVHQGYDYRFIGDEIFDLVPSWYLAKVDAKLPVATDYARLLLLQRALDEGYGQVLWLDADVVVFDPALQLEFAGTCAFGQENWVQPGRRGLEVRRNVSNALCVFRQGCVVLPFLLHTVVSLVQRVEAAHIAPQFVGPKLLNALHPLCDFALLPQVGALSPPVVEDLYRGEGAALALLRASCTQPLQAVNVCASLVDADSAASVVATLVGRGSL